MASISNIVLLVWGTNVVVHTLYVFSGCLKNILNNWLDLEVQQRMTKVYHNVLFFPDSRLVCRDYFTVRGCTLAKCRNAHHKTSLSELLDVLNQAERSLDICMFTISCHELANAALALHKNGVAVRIVTNEEQESFTGSQIERFQREGIQVRHDKSSYYMHHKFVLVDSRVLITGSFNWTRQAVLGNRENVLVTNDTTIVEPFMQEFEKLWQAYKPGTNK